MKLKELNTFGFDVRALYYSSPVSTEEAKASVAEARSKNLPILALGGGSNILFTRDYPGLVIHPRIGGIDIINEDHSSVLISVGAGIVWDRLVAYTVGRGWGGLENLTLIPGNTGASPVQNIGAYGVEAKDSIESVEGFYFDNLSDFKLDAESCRFNYRDSIFKRELQGKTLITRVEFRLSKNPKFELSYGKLDEEVAKYGQPTLTRRSCETRRRKHDRTLRIQRHATRQCRSSPPAGSCTCQPRQRNSNGNPRTVGHDPSCGAGEIRRRNRNRSKYYLK